MRSRGLWTFKVGKALVICIMLQGQLSLHR